MHVNLKVLVIQNCKWFRGDLLPCLGRVLPNLLTFECVQCRVTDSNLLEFIQLTKKIQTLKLSNLDNLDTFGAKLESESLESLELASVNITTESIARLAVSCPKLTSLVLRKTWYTCKK